MLGGGNVAMDAARTALRLGGRRSTWSTAAREKEMPARVEEVHHAKEEGVVFHLLQNAKRILGDDDGRGPASSACATSWASPTSGRRRRWRSRAASS